MAEKKATLFYGILHLGELVLANDPGFTYTGSVRTQDVVLRTCQEK